MSRTATWRRIPSRANEDSHCRGDQGACLHGSSPRPRTLIDSNGASACPRKRLLGRNPSLRSPCFLSTGSPTQPTRRRAKRPVRTTLRVPSPLRIRRRVGPTRDSMRLKAPATRRRFHWFDHFLLSHLANRQVTVLLVSTAWSPVSRRPPSKQRTL